MYTVAAWLWCRPIVIASSMKGLWLLGLSVLEWTAGRAYAIHCIGQNVWGWYDHLWSMGSPACVSMLTSHVALMGIFLASFFITVGIFVVWAYKRVQKDPHTKEMVEFVKECGWNIDGEYIQREVPRPRSENTYPDYPKYSAY